MKRELVGVSDHAVLRYLERVGGFEIEKLRANIALKVSQEYWAGQTSMTLDGFCFFIRIDEHGKPCVTTIFDRESKPLKAHRR